jgi:ATP-dependent phosphofructokinase / diphosphate-dependent phosphofructokinase
MASKCIAMNCGGGYVPGLNGVVIGAALAARELGWEVAGIHDGYDGLLFPQTYPDGGVIRFNTRMIDGLDAAGSVLGTGARNDPFRVRQVSEEGYVGEIDRSDDLLGAVRAEGIDAVISVVGGSALTGQHALSVAHKLSRKGLKTVCIPKSIENDVAVTAASFGFNSALSYATETLDRIRAAARDVRRLAVVEVPGHEAGWLALQSGIAALADVVLIPEIPYDLHAVADRLRERDAAGRRPSLVVAAEGAQAKHGAEPPEAAPADPRRKSLSPLSDPRFGEGAHVIERSGALAHSLALSLQRLTDMETMPFSLGQLVRGGAPTAVDRQLGLGYGAAAVQALSEGRAGVMIAFQPPDLEFVKLGEAINKIRTVPAESEFVRIGRALGVCLGE